MGVAHRRGQACGGHDLEVADVVADVGRLLGREAVTLEDVVEDRLLVDDALVELGDLQPLRPSDQALRTLAGDDPELEVNELGEEHAEAVLDVVGLDLLAVRQDG